MMISRAVEECKRNTNHTPGTSSADKVQYVCEEEEVQFLLSILLKKCSSMVKFVQSNRVMQTTLLKEFS